MCCEQLTDGDDTQSHEENPAVFSHPQNTCPRTCDRLLTLRWMFQAQHIFPFVSLRTASVGLICQIRSISFLWNLFVFLAAKKLRGDCFVNNLHWFATGRRQVVKYLIFKKSIISSEQQKSVQSKENWAMFCYGLQVERRVSVL